MPRRPKITQQSPEDIESQARSKRLKAKLPPDSSFSAGTFSPRWWAESGDNMGRALVTVADALERQDEYRRARIQRNLSLYEGRSVSLADDQYYSDTAMALQLPPQFNLVRSCCDTAQADVAGRQKPKPMFLTTGADWKTRRKAKKLDKWTEAQLEERQGMYCNVWQLMLDVFHDSCKVGTGLAKVFGDLDSRKIKIERVLPWEVHVDDRESRYGDPMNLFHVYDMERDLAIHVFCNRPDDPEGNEKRKQAILSAKVARASSTRVISSVRIREAWHLPFSLDESDDSGVHAFAVDNCLLHSEPYRRKRFPFVKLVWNKSTLGWWGVGIATEGEAQQQTLNDMAERYYERIRICSTKVTYFNPDVVKREQLEEGGDTQLLIPVKDMSQCPQDIPVNPVSPAEFQAIETSIKHFYEFRGVSQMSANAQKPPGVNAAVAMQTLNDIATIRFLPKARAYETAFEDLGQLLIDAATDIYDHVGDFSAKWPGKRFLETIDWSQVNLDEDMYSIKVAPVSQFSRDPAAILEMASELRQSGDITRETYLDMVGLPDFEEMLNRETAESDWIRELLDRYLDATNESELDSLGGYESPEPFMSNIPGAVAICVATYWEAKKDKAPEFCLQLIRQFINELQATVAQANQGAQQAALQQNAAQGLINPAQQIQTMHAGASMIGQPVGQPPEAGMAPPGQAAA